MEQRATRMPASLLTMKQKHQRSQRPTQRQEGQGREAKARDNELLKDLQLAVHVKVLGRKRKQRSQHRDHKTSNQDEGITKLQTMPRKEQEGDTKPEKHPRLDELLRCLAEGTRKHMSQPPINSEPTSSLRDRTKAGPQSSSLPQQEKVRKQQLILVPKTQSESPSGNPKLQVITIRCQRQPKSRSPIVFSRNPCDENSIFPIQSHNCLLPTQIHGSSCPNPTANPQVSRSLTPGIGIQVNVKHKTATRRSASSCGDATAFSACASPQLIITPAVVHRDLPFLESRRWTAAPHLASSVLPCSRTQERNLDLLNPISQMPFCQSEAWDRDLISGEFIGSGSGTVNAFKHISLRHSRCRVHRLEYPRKIAGSQPRKLTAVTIANKKVVLTIPAMTPASNTFND